MDTDLTVRPASDPEHQMLAALSPADVPATQQQLRTWCDQKIAALGARRSDLLDSVQVAKVNQWQTSTLTRHVRETEAEITYYTKIRDAVDAGFLIVPNFPNGTVLAVRVDDSRQAPPFQEEQHRHHLARVRAELGDSGTGKYVAPEPDTARTAIYKPTKENPNQHVSGYMVSGYRDPHFPVTAVKPIVMEATARAMALKIFDQIDVIGVKDRKTDPIVLGRIYRPKGYKARWGSQNGHISFFIAWWFSTSQF